tara:strand:+ start:3596 stop:4042 length:447 start_codon:yes stop_codon:yes gene_type:complete
MFESLKERIKEHEGFRNIVYKDSLGFATIGYGHLVTTEDNYEEGIEYSIEELEAVFEDDFESACNSAELVADNSDINLDEHPECVKEVLIEMVFQLGVGGVSKFKKFLANLSIKSYHLAADEMLDSRWAKQTPMRAEKLSYIIRQLAH